jgi:putative Holliday junction resolvase
MTFSNTSQRSDNQRSLAIDFGLKRLGLAVSDDRGVLAAPYAVRERKGLKRDIADLVETIQALRVALVVLGRPRHLQGENEHHKDKIQQFASALEFALREKNLPVTMEWWDERFSTAEAWRGLRDSGIRTRAGKDQVDAHAAAVILQGYLDARRGSNQLLTPDEINEDDECPN